MIVVVNGGYRTGSTLAYNIAGCIEEKSETGVRVIVRDKEYIDNLILTNNDTLNTVIKSHNNMPTMELLKKSKFIHTYRKDIRDCAASYKLIRPDVTFDYILKIMENQIKNQYYMQIFVNHPNVLILEYSEFVNNINFLVNKINVFLGNKLSDLQLIEIENMWSINSVKLKIKTIPHDDGYDPISQLRPHHISTFNGENGYWKNILSLEEQNLMDNLMDKYK